MKERLQRLGVEKTVALAEFVEDYESLGFSAQKVQKLAEWRKSLTETGISPDALESFIEKRGPLEKQLRSLEEELSQGKTPAEASNIGIEERNKWLGLIKASMENQSKLDRSTNLRQRKIPIKD
jgi:DNA-binding transcriptional MerR regulator